jgi:hypothetical protein
MIREIVLRSEQMLSQRQTRWANYVHLLPKLG